MDAAVLVARALGGGALPRVPHEVEHLVGGALRVIREDDRHAVKTEVGGEVRGQGGGAAALVVGQAVLALDGAADLGPVRRHDAGRPDTRAARRAKYPGQKIGTEDDAALQVPLLLEKEAADAVLLGDPVSYTHLTLPTKA